MSEWQPIETVPKDDDILIFSPSLGMHVVFHDDGHDPDFPWHTLDGSSAYHKERFTHWMPLPEPPK